MVAYDDDIDELDELSNKQKELRFIIWSSNCEYQIQALKHQRNVLLKEIWKRVSVSREKEIEEAVKSMERLQEIQKVHSCKEAEHERFENPFVHDRNGKHASNPGEGYKIIKDHFKPHFYEQSIESLHSLLGRRKNSVKQLQQKK